MRALITGISGFGGSHLAEYLLERGDTEVSGLVRDPARPGHAGPFAARVQLLTGDLHDAASLERALSEARPDVVYHLGGQAFVPRSFEDPEGTLQDNAVGQLHLIQALLARRPQARLLAVGSASVYGLVRPEENPVHEEVPWRPVDPYGVSKAAQDLLAFQYGVTHDLQAVRVRPFNHTGPRQSDAFAPSWFARQVAAIEAGAGPPELEVGNLDAVRDYTDVRDMVRAYHLAATQGAVGEAYNLGSGTGHRLGEVLQTLVGLSRVPCAVRQDASRLRPLDVPLLVCDAGRFRQRTGWAPEIELQQTLRDLLDYWRARGTGAP
jgi:GDP-4-dehydro-6-deoxy-D-mannose reductase